MDGSERASILKKKLGYARCEECREHQNEKSRIMAQRRKDAGPIPTTEIIKRRLNLFGNNTCCFCNTVTPDIQLEHLVSVRMGGTNEPNNLFGICRKCNPSKLQGDWKKWFRQMPFYSKEREDEIERSFWENKTRTKLFNSVFPQFEEEIGDLISNLYYMGYYCLDPELKDEMQAFAVKLNKLRYGYD
jgi:5-methylcytosine-specific restriction endonuclease McrA